MRTFSRALLSFGLALALLAGSAPTSSPALAQDGTLTPIEQRQPAPDVSMERLDGGRTTLAELQGQVVIISFWATWCRPCLQELPHMERFLQTYGDQGLAVLAISTDQPDSLAQVRSIVRRNDWTMNVLLDPEGAITQLLNPRGNNPFTIIVDRAGRIVESHEGYSAGDETHYETVIQALLAESAP
jgi:peroxiredoxin